MKPLFHDINRLYIIQIHLFQEKKREILDDAFLMVTQANWEDDVIWNGDDIKHKVLQKLNNKSNAAGKFYYTSHNYLRI